MTSEIKDPIGIRGGYCSYRVKHDTKTGETELWMPSKKWWKFGAMELVGTYTSLNNANIVLEYLL